MKKILLYVLVIAMLLSTTAFAATNTQINTADALYSLGLFQGRGGTAGYALDENLTRAEGMALLIRMIGKDEEVKDKTYNTPFVDVPDWAAGYVGYAYTNKITDGMGPDKFGPNVQLSDNMFLTLVLRALGYVDKGENAQFTWDKPYALAKKIGLISSEAADKSFTRGEAIVIFWNAMSAKFVGEDMTLAESLIQQKVFTKAELQLATDIQAGKVADVERPAGGIGGSGGSGSGGNDDGGNTGGDTGDNGDSGAEDTDTDTGLEPDQTPWG